MLAFEDFCLELPGPQAARPVLDSVTMSVGPGEVVGLVGESGSGKSTTAKAAVGLLPDGARTSGSVRVDGRDVLDLDPSGIRDLRTHTAAMIFQDPRTTLNPVRTVGDFLVEQLRQAGQSKGEARERMIDLLSAVHVTKPELRMRQYPHELSGGMLQRVVIAAALASEPALVLADEPTSALDVSTQAETMALLAELRAEREFAMLFITHDLHLAAALCDRVHVMYAGRLVEEQAGATLFTDPRHPYTRGLLGSVPDLHGQRTLQAVPGHPLTLDEAVTGCPFAPRCAWVEEECRTWRPELRPTSSGARAACRREQQVAEALDCDTRTDSVGELR